MTSEVMTDPSVTEGKGHTPGPWEGWDPKNPAIDDEIWGDGRLIAHTVPLAGDGDCAEERANAHLIAAAPELFAACVDWLRWLDPNTPEPANAAAHEQRLLDAMRAAIAKASPSPPEAR